MNDNQPPPGGPSRSTAARVATPVVAAALALILSVAVLSAGAPAAGARPLATPPICVSKPHPRLAARMSTQIAAAVRGRRSAVGLAVDDEDLAVTCRLDASWQFYAASVIKVTIISALLRKIRGPSHLTKAQQALAWQMITQSNNNAATTLWNETGHAAMQRFLTLAKMTRTVLNTAWGLTLITAGNELLLMRLLTSPGTVLAPASRAYVLWLMAHVTPAQSWGVTAGVPAAAKVTIHVKNGWLPYPTGSNWRINSIGAFTGSHVGWQTTVLTASNPSMSYGIDTVQAAARVINRDLGNF
jgi:hypothetical protein